LNNWPIAERINRTDLRNTLPSAPVVQLATEAAVRQWERAAVGDLALRPASFD
jgi:hypothetical protein